MTKAPFSPLDRRAPHSVTLPGYLYSAPDVFAEEQEKIFAKTWQLAAHRAQLPSKGDYLTMEVAGEQLIVINGGDKIRAFYNVCQHRAHRILTGSGRVRAKMVCPYHAWTYDLDGSLAAARHVDALPDFDKSCFGLKAVRAEEALGFIFVNLDPDAASLQDSLGDCLADMQRVLPWIEEAEVDVEATGDSWAGNDLQANWKVLAENCLECYHCAPAHKALVDMLDMKSYRVGINGAWMKSESGIGKENNKAYSIEVNDPQREAHFWHVWPNIEFGILPGEKSLGAFRFFPVGPETTRMTALILSGDGQSVRQDRLNYRWNVLWPEDKGLCMSVHEGLKSRGYSQGRFVVDPEAMGVSEHAVHAFQLRYAEAMGLAVA